MLTDVTKLAHAGEGIRIYEQCKIARPESVSIGDGTQIDDFVFINGGDGVELGRFNHIASFVSVVGGGRLVTGTSWRRNLGAICGRWRPLPSAVMNCGRWRMVPVLFCGSSFCSQDARRTARPKIRRRGSNQR